MQRKVGILWAALGLALLAVVFPSSPLEAKGRERSFRQRPLRSGNPLLRKARPSGRARRIIRQDGAGDVILDRIVTGKLELLGPFLPPEPQNFPQPLCEALDVVLEAHVHEAGADAEEAPEVPAAQAAREPSPAGLLAVAKRIGSLFRPKSSVSRVSPKDVDLPDLLSVGFQIPVEGVDVQKLKDSFLDSRGRYKRHLAIDIGAPRGTPILATTDGEIVRLSRERRGGISLYQKDSTGRYLLFYCHLSGYAEGLEVGQQVAKGEVVGYVGSTGRVRGGPHLHFSITRLPEDDDNFREGLAINPYLLFLASVP